MDLENSAQAQAMVNAIISLAHSLRFSVVAEGVETEGQADILRTLECDLMQGFLFSKAVPFDTLANMLPKAT
jgi:EAL domain-containing protein (putative c-di-GMP-specific phosphodiesterase class I)